MFLVSTHSLLLLCVNEILKRQKNFREYVCVRLVVYGCSNYVYICISSKVTCTTLYSVHITSNPVRGSRRLLTLVSTHLCICSFHSFKQTCHSMHNSHSTYPSLHIVLRRTNTGLLALYCTCEVFRSIFSKCGLLTVHTAFASFSTQTN